MKMCQVFKKHLSIFYFHVMQIRKQCSWRAFQIQNKFNTRLFESSSFPLTGVTWQRNRSIFIKRRQITTSGFLYSKTFALQTNQLSDCLPEINLCCLLTAWTRRSLITSHRSKQLHVSQSRNVPSDYAGVERCCSDTWSHFTSVRYVTDVCTWMLWMKGGGRGSSAWKRQMD